MTRLPRMLIEAAAVLAFILAVWVLAVALEPLALSGAVQ